MYKIVIDPTHALVRLDMEGMLSPAESDQLVGDLIRSIGEARLRRYAIIIDVTRCGVQSQDMIAAMASHLTKMQNAYAIALVTGTTLVRMQVRRIFPQSIVHFASTYDEALRWILSRSDGSAASPTG